MARPVLTDAQWAKVDRIDGWLTREEADLLYGLCQGPWLEVGAWKGKSTTVLAETGHPGYVLDWFRGSPEHDPSTWTLPEYAENIRPYPHVRTIVASIDDVSPQVFRPTLIHLDADHSYEGTRDAFDKFAAASSATVVFHDYKIFGGDDPWPGVTRFVDELLEGGRWKYADRAHRSIALRRA